MRNPSLTQRSARHGISEENGQLYGVDLGFTSQVTWGKLLHTLSHATEPDRLVRLVYFRPFHNENLWLSIGNQ